MSKNLPLEEQSKYIRAFATPFWVESNKAYLEKVGKKRGGFLAAEEERLGGGTVPSAGFRVFNKKTQKYETVTKEQYDMIRGQ